MQKKLADNKKSKIGRISLQLISQSHSLIHRLWNLSSMPLDLSLYDEPTSPNKNPPQNQLMYEEYENRSGEC